MNDPGGPNPYAAQVGGRPIQRKLSVTAYALAGLSMLASAILVASPGLLLAFSQRGNSRVTSVEIAGVYADLVWITVGSLLGGIALGCIGCVLFVCAAKNWWHNRNAEAATR
ncbi:MAG: hypothetical protein Aurels2KO_33910 [Aureliella sp.]